MSFSFTVPLNRSVESATAFATFLLLGFLEIGQEMSVNEPDQF